MFDKKIRPIGLVAGVISWFIFCLIGVSKASCIKLGNACDGHDLFLSMMIGVGMLAPAYIVSLLASIFLKK